MCEKLYSFSSPILTDCNRLDLCLQYKHQNNAWAKVHPKKRAWFHLHPQMQPIRLKRVLYWCNKAHVYSIQFIKQWNKSLFMKGDRTLDLYTNTSRSIEYICDMRNISYSQFLLLSHLAFFFLFDHLGKVSMRLMLHTTDQPTNQPHFIFRLDLLLTVMV